MASNAPPEPAFAGRGDAFPNLPGPMAAWMRSTDWAATALGAIDQWPASLRTMVGVALGNPFPTNIWWGPDLRCLYNDGYRSLLGNKHPRSLGAPGREVWAEIWPVVGPLAEAILAGGPATYKEHLRLLMDRKGYLEETYFTFSYSPIPDDEGHVGGVLITALETTHQVHDERQLRTLRDLGAPATVPRTAESACREAARPLTDNADIPFLLLYLAEGERAELVAAAGLANEEDAPRTLNLSPERLRLSAWPFVPVGSCDAGVIVEVPAGVHPTRSETPSTSPSEAVVVPLLRQGVSAPTGFLIAGVNPLRKVDDRYCGFLRLVADQIASAVSNARAHESEKAHSERLAEIDRAERARLQHLLTNVPAAVCFLKGPDLVIEFANLAALEIGGDRDIMHKPLLTAFPEYRGQPLVESLRQVYATGKPWSANEMLVKIASGDAAGLEDSYWNITCAPIRAPSGGVEGVVTFSVEVTRQVRAHEALRAERDRIEDLAATAPGVLCSFRLRPDGTTCVPYASKGLFEMCGLSWQELLDDAEPMFARMHPEDIARVRTSVADSARLMTPWRCEFRFVHPSKGDVWTEGHSVPKRELDGSILWHGFIADVTERHLAAEAQLRSQKMEALGTLAGGIAHDFNNILFAIAGNLEFARAELPASSPAQPFLAAIETGQVRATDLVRRILTFSRQREQRRAPMSLADVLQEAIQLLRPTLFAMIELKCTYASAVPLISGDASQIHQIVVNLVTNAAHAIGNRAGRIVVTLDAVDVDSQLARSCEGLQPGRHARLSVRDDGCGMNSTTIERIFDPFFTTKQAEQGTGLGLSVVHGIIKSHDGAITVQSQLGQGTTFEVYFPVATATAVQPEKQPVEAVEGAGQRVLYVDDEEDLGRLVTRKLQATGYQVVAYTNPRKALEAVRAAPHQFDVVVSDLSMPAMSGLDLITALREVRPDLPAVLVSGYIPPDMERLVRERGVHEVIIKPNALRQLGPALLRVLGNRARSVSEPAAS